LPQDQAGFVIFKEKFVADKLVGGSLVFAKESPPLRILYPETPQVDGNVKNKGELYENPDNYRMNYQECRFRVKKVEGFTILEKDKINIWAK